MFLFLFISFTPIQEKVNKTVLSLSLFLSVFLSLYIHFCIMNNRVQTFFFLSMCSSLCSVFLEIFIYVASVYKNPLPPFSILFPNVYLTLFYPKEFFPSICVLCHISREEKILLKTFWQTLSILCAFVIENACLFCTFFCPSVLCFRRNFEGMDVILLFKGLLLFHFCSNMIGTKLISI